MPSVSGSTSEAPVESRESSFRSEEMDDLMRRITDSLRLKASCKQKVHAQRGLQRSKPYSLPTPKKCQSCHGHGQCKYRKRHHPCEKSCQDDPHDLLKELLRDRSLIAEAVKRLKFKLDETLFSDRTAERSAVADCVYDYECEVEDNVKLNTFVCS